MEGKVTRKDVLNRIEFYKETNKWEILNTKR
jgi:hypothetical protein